MSFAYAQRAKLCLRDSFQIYKYFFVSILPGVARDSLGKSSELFRDIIFDLKVARTDAWAYSR